MPRFSADDATTLFADAAFAFAGAASADSADAAGADAVAIALLRATDTRGARHAR